ncbi:MAG TPA: hypothetical protein VF088_18630 [Pyrinomonadaceae bacterium]
MKRCPQCEFIYEDDQSLCDMDGVLLVFDGRTLPDLHALTTIPPRRQPKRNKAVPAFATVVLALVLGMVYYVSTERNAIENPEIPPVPIAASMLNPVPAENPISEVQPSTEKSAAGEPKAPTTKSTVAAPVPLKKPATASVAETRKPEPKKEDSKVNSILKKTGRILKKPFKF